MSGHVYIIGAGPGDPGLLTLKGKSFIEEADVIIYDNLIGKRILDFSKEGAELIYVGKNGSCHTIPQTEINSLLVKKAKEGKIVARVKGGDPFIFGRGGEEAEALLKEGISYDVVPGVTSAIAAPAYAGIPLTHRDYSSTVSFITGYESHGKKESSLYWEKIATGIGTLVILMGIKSLSRIIKNLLDNGRAPDTPVAIIQWGTMPHQKIVYSDLQTIEVLIKKENISTPGIIVVGEVVSLGKKLNWFEKKTLFSKKILITRAEEQAGSFISLIERRGGIPVICPSIKTIPPDSWDSLDTCIDIIDSYDWVIFTSVNAVRYFLERLRAKEKDIRELKGVKICSIGLKTADAIKSYGLKIDLIPEKSVAESVVESFSKFSLNGMRFFMPRAKEARDVIPDALRQNHAVIDIGIAYQTVSSDAKSCVATINGLLERDEIDVLTFTSSSTVTNFMKMVDVELIKKSKKIVIASIGSVTAESVVKSGLKNDIIPLESTIESLTESIEEYFLLKRN